MLIFLSNSLIISGYDSLTRQHFRKVSDAKGTFYTRAKLLGTKNHPKDSQDLRKGGIINYGANEFGLDAGLFYELSENFANSEDNHIFQLPHYGKKLRKNIHKNGYKPYFYAKKVGHNLIHQMMPKVNSFLEQKIM